jgi:metallothiol transferase
MIKVSGVAQLGLPVNDLERAIGFYREVLGMSLVRRIVSRQRPDTTQPTIAELKAGTDSVFLFERPHPRTKDALQEDGIAHHALSVSREQFDAALTELKQLGLFRMGPVEYPSGLSLYFFDSEGNHLQLEVSV